MNNVLVGYSMTSEDPVFYHWLQNVKEKKEFYYGARQKRHTHKIKLQEYLITHDAHMSFYKKFQSDYDEQVKHAKSEIRKARAQHKNPLVKHLAYKFPICILNMLMEYNSSEVCANCYDYVPKSLNCQGNAHSRTVMHSGLVVKNKQCIWNDQKLQSVWDDCVNMVIENIQNELTVSDVFYDSSSVFTVIMTSNSVKVSLSWLNHIIFQISNHVGKKRNHLESESTDSDD